MLDVATGTVFFAKNENKRLPIASTTKIMTALVVLEYARLDALYTIQAKEAQTEGSSLELRKGDVLSIRSLLFGLMLVSGNDAAVALANACAGSEEQFVKLMNRKANQIGLRDTHFMNASGLTQKGHYSTAHDMALLAAFALQQKGFEALCASWEKQIEFVVPSKSVYLRNHNRLLKEYEGCIGMKTGYTQAAGRCLVSAARRNGQTCIAVTLCDSNDWEDHRAMLDYAFENSEEVVFEGIKTHLPVVGGVKKSVALEGDAMRIYVPKSVSSALKRVIFVPHFIYAPVVQNEKIGEVTIYCANTPVARTQLRAETAIRKTQTKKTFWERIKALWQT